MILKLYLSKVYLHVLYKNVFSKKTKKNKKKTCNILKEQAVLLYIGDLMVANEVVLPMLTRVFATMSNPQLTPVTLKYNTVIML